MAKRILLTGVFGPFGVDDEFGRRENIMELFHNQVTKAQGVASIRYHHRSFGLYFLAENVSAPVTVLDFPSRARFEKVLRSERFDAVGISFIVPNVSKAREMARMVRRIQPEAEIILGGHGTAIEGIESMIDCDHVVRGEGISWLRRYCGDDPAAPIRHPSLPSTERKRVFGIPVPGTTGLLVPGVGCVNGCRFCATSHFFDRSYSAFSVTGEQLFRNACQISEEIGCNEFFVMDENFLKSRDRALDLLARMEREKKAFNFGIFSSAEAIDAFGIANMVRLGVFFVWIGAESRAEVYEKNKGRDLKKLVRDLRDAGIAVLVSGILFSEQHTPENVWDDIDYIIDLGGDLTQFMQLTPLPGTKLYFDKKDKGLLDFDLPYEEWHGQHLLNWRHPAFTRGQTQRILADAFRAEFDRNSSSLYRMTDTTLRGYRALEEEAKHDPWLAIRRDQLRERSAELRLLLPTFRRFAHDATEAARVRKLDRDLGDALGPLSLVDRAKGVAGRLLAEAYALRFALGQDRDQPKTIVTLYRQEGAVAIETGEGAGGAASVEESEAA
jgi:radical SAM superfamily enzyme YgiQ (UPF0313 family)